ncbi:MAG: hypothetical protein HN368_17205, partial [Spirochaetales bacterium]|nr:hypothetical protein [Spirochaetales bacterium]
MIPSSRRGSYLLIKIVGLLAGVFLLMTCAGVSRQESGAEMPSDSEASMEVMRAAPEMDASPETDISPARLLTTESLFPYKAPELLSRVDGSEMESLELMAQDVTVIITGHRARIIFDLVFYNHSESVLSGEFMVQIPDRAGPSSLGMFQGHPYAGVDWSEETGSISRSVLLAPTPSSPDSLMGTALNLENSWDINGTATDWGEFRPAVVVEPAQGRQVYETITRQKVDPALGEWTGTGSYSTRIFPLPPRSLKRVVFSYDQTLVPDEGAVTYQLPAIGSSAGERLTIHDIGVSFSQSGVTIGGKSLEQQRSGLGRMWQTAGADWNDGAVEFRGVMRNPALLHLTGADTGITGTLTTAVFTPELPSRSMVTPTGRALVLLDTSYSGRDGLSDQSGRILKALLESDDSLTDFAVVCFDVRPTLLTTGFVANTVDSRSHYLAQIAEIWLEGATDFNAVLDYVAADAVLSSADTIFLLSDGIITWGSDDVAGLAREYEQLLQSRWICYGVGTMPRNGPLFEELTRTGGQIVPVMPSQDLSKAARAHRFPVSRLDGVFSAMQDEIVIAGRPEFVYPGQVLEIAVRNTQGLQDLRLIVRIEGRETEMKIPLTRAAVTESIAARSWAEVYTASLLADQDEATIQASLSMSRHFNLTNNSASFIILETDEEYTQYEIAAPEFDFKQIRLTLLDRRLNRGEAPRLYAGLPIPENINQEKVNVIKGLAALRDHFVWETPDAQSALTTPKVLLEEPTQVRLSDTFPQIHSQAERILNDDKPVYEDEVLRKENEALSAAHALRVVSTIAELKPRDAQALRLTGFVLMDWGFYEEAVRIFTRVRQSRPFEPQNFILEALALTAAGHPGDAALRYEVILNGHFPRFEAYAEP